MTAPAITRAEWGLILVLVAVQFTHMVDFVIVMPLGGRLMTEFRLSPAEFAHVVSAYAWAAGVASLLAAAVMDRFDRRTTLLTMYAGFTVSTLYCGFANTFEALLAGRALAGAFGGTAAVALMAVVGDAFAPDKRGRVSGALVSAFAVASIAGLPAGLSLAAHFDRSGAPFVALAGLSAAVWVLAWAQLPPLRGHLTAARPNRWRELAGVIRHRDHLVAFAFTFALVVSTFSVISFIGPYLTATNGWGERELRVIYFAAGLCTLAGTSVVGRLADRVSRAALFRALAVVAVGLAVGITNLPACPLWAAAVLLSAFMVFAAGRMVPVQALLLGVPAAQNRGAFMSVNTAVQHAGTGAAPAIAGALVTENADKTLSGYPLVGIVAVACGALALLLVGRLKPARPDAPKE
jgi:MFS transporter, DHA1 family, inner membrane transport protein